MEITTGRTNASRSVISQLISSHYVWIIILIPYNISDTRCTTRDQFLDQLCSSCSLLISNKSSRATHCIHISMPTTPKLTTPVTYADGHIVVSHINTSCSQRAGSLSNLVWKMKMIAEMNRKRKMYYQVRRRRRRQVRQPPCYHHWFQLKRFQRRIITQ